MTDGVSVDSLPMHEALAVQLTGALTGRTAARAAAALDAATKPLPPPAHVMIDMRELTELTAAGARVLLDLAHATASRGIRCSVVVDPGSEAAEVVRTADPGGTLARFPGVAEALAGPDPTVVDSLEDEFAGTTAVLERFELLTRTLLDTATVGAALHQVVHATLHVVGADLVSVTLRAPDGELSTPAETSPIAAMLDEVQYRHGRGPCLDAARPDAPGYATSEDLRAEQRWPDFAAAALEQGYHAILSTELFLPSTPDPLAGALNVYRRAPGPFSATDRHAALLLATHASLALTHSHAIELADVRQAELRRAIDSRDVIGQAKGILMSRQGITADEAFALLSRTSQDLNVKLVDLARTLTDRHADLDRPQA